MNRVGIYTNFEMSVFNLGGMIFPLCCDHLFNYVILYIIASHLYLEHTLQTI